MTPAEWKVFEAALSLPYGSARLRCGAHDVSFQVVFIKPMRLAIQTYVDGYFKGAWCRANNPCPEQSFMRRRQKKLHKPSDLQGMKRIFGAKKYAEMAAKTYVWFEAQWPSAATLRRHLVATCGDATLVFPSLPGSPVSAEEKAAVLEGAS